MKIVKINSNVIDELRTANISTNMKSLESCEWIVLEKNEDGIEGAAGMGGVFHVSGIQIAEKFRGKGIGKKIQNELINECIRRGYSFITVFNDPRNKTSVQLHDSLGYKKLFRIHYAKNIVNDVKGIAFYKKGRLFIQLLRFFNTKTGTILLAIALKMLHSVFPALIIYNEDGLPKPDVKWIIKNFEKI